MTTAVTSSQRPVADTSARIRTRGSLFGDTLTIAKRNLLVMLRTPQVVVFSSLQPVMFLLLFRYVFGGSIRTGQSYVNYLVPGMVLQMVLFGGTTTAISLAEDSNKGILDRFRSLPMNQTALLAGRALADVVRNLFVILLLLVVGSIIGFRFGNGVGGAVAMVAMALFFGFCFAWFFAWIGLSVKNAEAAQLATFLPIFPLVFASSIFTLPKNMPTALRVFAENQPLTHTANAVRGLALGGPAQGEIVRAIAWMLAILLVFGSLAVRRFRKG